MSSPASSKTHANVADYAISAGSAAFAGSGGNIASITTDATLSMDSSPTAPLANVNLKLVTPVAVEHGGTGTATPGLVQGSNVSISGSWPNQMIAAHGSGVSKYSQTFGDGSATSYVITHNLGTKDVIVQVYSLTSPYAVQAVTIQMTSANTVTIVFGVAPAANSMRVVVLA
jgi:hypothetical protein